MIAEMKAVLILGTRACKDSCFVQETDLYAVFLENARGMAAIPACAEDTHPHFVCSRRLTPSN